jgi:glutamate-1-semialdehyde 2,1-aminomutase
MKRRGELTRGPVYTLPTERLAEFRAKIVKKCPASKKFHEKAKQCLPGGAQHMLVNKDPFPITVKKARGCTVTDIDDNTYTNYFMMAGPIILGHNYPPLIKEVTKVIKEEGIGTGWTSKWEIRVAELVKKYIPSVELIRYFQSGTEANMAAARVARVFTKKKKIVKIGGSYHGWADQFVYSAHIPHSGTFESAGIPDECFAQLVCTNPNDVDGLEAAFKAAESDGGIAAVFIEPLGGESGGTPMHPDFPKALRGLCDRYEALLVFDEVVTAFRLDIGGAQKYYGVKPDLTIFGKILTHGFPSSGAVGGRRDVMECFVSGLQPGKGHAFVGGTMGANPISTSAGYWALKYIKETRAVDKAGRAADRLVAGLNGIFERRGFPFFAYNFKSIIHFETAAPVAVDIREKDGIMSALARKQSVDQLAMALLAEGVITKYGNRAFTSLAHTDKDIDATLEVFDKVLKLLRA